MGVCWCSYKLGTSLLEPVAVASVTILSMTVAAGVSADKCGYVRAPNGAAASMAENRFTTMPQNCLVLTSQPRPSSATVSANYNGLSRESWQERTKERSVRPEKAAMYRYSIDPRRATPSGMWISMDAPVEPLSCDEPMCSRYMMLFQPQHTSKI